MSDEDWSLLQDVLKWRGITLSDEEQEYYRAYSDPAAAQRDILSEHTVNPWSEALTAAQRNI